MIKRDDKGFTPSQVMSEGVGDLVACALAVAIIFMVVNIVDRLFGG